MSNEVVTTFEFCRLVANLFLTDWKDGKTEFTICSAFQTNVDVEMVFEIVQMIEKN